MLLSDFSIRRPISISMIALGVLLMGVVSVGGIPLNLLPDISFPRVTVRTEYPQAAPAEVENIVTRPIEQVVGILNNVVKITSVSKSGLSDVVVEFGWGSDLDVVTMEMREKLQMLQFPDDVKKPLILRYDPSQDPIMTIGVTADMSLSELRYLVEQDIQRELERIDGVAAVRVQGGYEEEIMVEIDEARMTRLGISIAQVADRLKRENINLAGGTLRDAGAELAVRTTNAFATLDDIRNLVIQTGASGVSKGAGGNMSSQLTGLGMVGPMASAALPGAGAFAMPGVAEAANAGEVRLKDFATVERKPKRRAEIARLDNKECVQVSVYKEGDANVVAVCRSLRRVLKRIKGNLRKKGAVEEVPEWSEIWDKFRASPAEATEMLSKKLRNIGAAKKADFELVAGMKIVTIVDQAMFIENAISAVYQTAVWGALIAIMALYFFLRSIKSTFIIAVSIPVSIVATFNMMFFFHITWNVMSLGGLALGVGMLVDNAIVVLENIFRIREEEGGGEEETAERGVNEVSTAITASTLTNIAVFFPIVFVVGIAGQIFKDLALTVTFSLLLSEAAAFTLVPMLSIVMKVGVEDAGQPSLSDGGAGVLTRAMGRTIGGVYNAVKIVMMTLFKWPLRIFDASFDAVKKFHPKLLKWTLNRPRATVVASILISLMAFGVLLELGLELIPSVDQGEFTIHMEMATGTPIDVTNEKVEEVEASFEKLRKKAFFQNMFTSVGYGVGRSEGVQQKSENIAELHIMLKQDRPIDDLKAMEILRRAMNAVLAGADVKMFRPTLLSFRTPVEIEISGNNLNELKRLSGEVAKAISGVPGLYDIENTGRESNPEVQIKVDRDKASFYGLTTAQVTDAIRKKVKGELATDLDEGERQVDIIVQAREKDRNSLERIADLTVPRPGGAPVPLKVIASLTPAMGPGVIHRSGNGRVALVTANLSGRPLGDVARDIEKRLRNMPARPGYYMRVTGQNEEMQKSLISLVGATVLAMILVYIVLSSLFESLVHPFVIMFTVPYSMVGVALILLLTGGTLNVFSFIGIMMMVGIAVNDAIVFVETVNQNRRSGQSRREALMSAGESRLRPILITTLTTVFGMAPMALIGGEGAELRAPIAIAVIGGLTVATIFTLVFIPAVYEILDRIRPGGGAKPPKTPDEKAFIEE